MGRRSMDGFFAYFFLEEMGGKVSHFFHKVGDGIEDGVHDIGHVADDAINWTRHAAVAVGHDVAHVAGFIPGVGGAIKKGLVGLTNLANRQVKMYGDVIHDASHPLDTLKKAVHIISNPASLKRHLLKGLRTAKAVSGDMANAATIAGPEFAELGKAAGKANQILGKVDDLTRGKLPTHRKKKKSKIEKKGKKGKAVKKPVSGKLFSSAGLFDPELSFPFQGEDDYAAFVPYDHALEYLQSLHPGQDLTVHLFDGLGNWLASCTVPHDFNEDQQEEDFDEEDPLACDDDNVALEAGSEWGFPSHL